MNVTQLLDALLFCPNIEIVEPCSPKMIRAVIAKWDVPLLAVFARSGNSAILRNTISPQPPNKSKFQRLYRERKISPLWFSQKKMDMFGHNHISENSDPVPASNSFESRKEKITSTWVIKEWTTLVATERYEMKIASTVKALWMIGHERRLRKGYRDVCDE